MTTKLDMRRAVLDDRRTSQMGGDFARGQRDPDADVIRIGTFAHGQRQRPVVPLVTRRAHHG